MFSHVTCGQHMTRVVSRMETQAFLRFIPCMGESSDVWETANWTNQQTNKQERKTNKQIRKHYQSWAALPPPHPHKHNNIWIAWPAAHDCLVMFVFCFHARSSDVFSSLHWITMLRLTLLTLFLRSVLALVSFPLGPEYDQFSPFPASDEDYVRGSVWPKPQVRVQSGVVYSLLPSEFKFTSVGESSDVLNAAIERYSNITFPDSAQKNATLKQITALKIDVQSKMEPFSPGADESCRYFSWSIFVFVFVFIFYPPPPDQFGSPKVFTRSLASTFLLCRLW